jgi:hypothetical protein
VNLTPFAGLLSNGQPHTVSLSVYNADSYFSATASLLLYLDSGSTQTSGAITQNTLAAPNPQVTENLNVQSTFTKGTVDVTSDRNFVISGYVNTSKGKVTTKVVQNVDFSNKQFFNITATAFEQNIVQNAIIGSTVTTSQPGAAATVNTQNYAFPLAVNIAELVLKNTDILQTTTADQTYQLTTSTAQGGKTTYSSSLINAGQHNDTLELNSSFELLSNFNQSASQQYNSSDSTGATYSCDISAAANVLTSFTQGCAP